MGRLEGANAAPFAYASHVLGTAAAVLVLVRCIDFRGGLAFESSNKSLIFNWIFGFVAYFFPGATPNLRRESLPWHKIMGLFVYVMAVASAELGFLERLTFLEGSGLNKYGTEAFLVNFIALMVVLFGASIVISAVAPSHVEAHNDVLKS